MSATVGHLSMYEISKYREITRRKLKSSAVVKHQRTFVVLKTTSTAKGFFTSSDAPHYRSLVTSLKQHAHACSSWYKRYA